MEAWQQTTIQSLETSKKKYVAKFKEVMRRHKQVEKELRAAEAEVTKIEQAIAAIRGQGNSTAKKEPGKPSASRDDLMACVLKVVQENNGNGGVRADDLKSLVMDELRPTHELTGVTRQFQQWVDELDSVTLTNGVYHITRVSPRRAAANGLARSGA